MVCGSRMSQDTTSVGSAVNGSTKALSGSGSRTMSEFWMPFHPAIDEPSNMRPSSSSASSAIEAGKVTWCHTPRMSVKRRSMNSMRWSLIRRVMFSIDIGRTVAEAGGGRLLVVLQAACQGEGKTMCMPWSGAEALVPWGFTACGPDTPARTAGVPATVGSPRMVQAQRPMHHLGAKAHWYPALPRFRGYVRRSPRRLSAPVKSSPCMIPLPRCCSASSKA